MNKTTEYKDFIKRGSSQFPPEKNRYHLYISYPCPFAHRVLMVIKLKGLEDVIGITVANPIFQKTKENESHVGWAFGKNQHSDSGKITKIFEESQDDPYLGAKFVRDIYEKAANANPQNTKFSVPLLYDHKNNLIVNNQSEYMIKIFNSEFNEFAKHPEVDLSPRILEEQQSKDLEKKIVDNLCDGVYDVGFAETQENYEKAFNTLFDTLDELDKRLQDKKLLFGNDLTIVDLKLFAFLVRFDEVFYVLFKANKKLIVQYPNLLRYTKDIYNTGNIKSTVNYNHIISGYYLDFPTLNPSGIIPLGNNFQKNLEI